VKSSVKQSQFLIEADLISNGSDSEQLTPQEQESGKLVVRHDPEKTGSGLLQRVFEHIRNRTARHLSSQGSS